MVDSQTQQPGSSPPVVSMVPDDSGSPFDPAKYKGIVDLQKQRAKDESTLIDKTSAESDRMMHNAEYFFRQEGIGPDNAPKPWDADKEHRKFETNPIEGLGSVGGLFAVIASNFTKAPMANAINGMAGAINSLKEGNEDAYKRAYESYKENTKLALERQKIQHEQYQDALELMKTNMAAGAAKFKMLTAKFDDQQAAMVSEMYGPKEVYEIMEARQKAAEQMAQYNDSTTERTLRDTAYKAAAEGLPKTGNPQVDAAHKLALFTRTHSAVKETPQQALMGQYFLEHPEATAEEAAEFADKHGIIRQYGSNSGPLTEPKLVAQEVKRRADEMIEGGMDPAEAFDKAMKGVKASQQEGRGSLTRLDSAEVKRRIEELKTEHPDWSEDKVFNEARSSVAAARTGGVLEGEALDIQAARYNSGDHSGMAGVSAPNRVRVLQRASEQLIKHADERKEQLRKEHPDWEESAIEDAAKASPEALGKALALSSSDYQATRVALRTLANRSVNIQTAAVEARKFLVLAQRASDQIPRSNVVPFNKLLQTAEKDLSDPKLKAFASYNNALVNQYVRAISGTGAPTDMVRAHAYELLQTSDGPAAYKAVTKTMDEEMEAAIESPDAVRDRIMGRASPDKSNVTGKEPSKVLRYDAKGNMIQ